MSRSYWLFSALIAGVMLALCLVSIRGNESGRGARWRRKLAGAFLLCLAGGVLGGVEAFSTVTAWAKEAPPASSCR